MNYAPNLYNYQQKLYRAFNLQISNVYNWGEQAKVEYLREIEKLEEWNFLSDLIDKINNPEKIDYSFLKKYGLIFLIFFILLWYLTRRK